VVSEPADSDFIEWGTELPCPGCGEEITPRYALSGVCRDCIGTTDDPRPARD